MHYEIVFHDSQLIYESNVIANAFHSYFVLKMPLRQ